MSKGSYSVREDDANPPRQDTSFRSFICALLIFLAICLIIFLVAFNWKSGKDESPKHAKDDAEVLGRQGVNETNQKEKIVVITVPKPTRARTTSKLFTAITAPVTRKSTEEIYIHRNDQLTTPELDELATKITTEKSDGKFRSTSEDPTKYLPKLVPTTEKYGTEKEEEFRTTDDASKDRIGLVLTTEEYSETKDGKFKTTPTDEEFRTTSDDASKDRVGLVLTTDGEFKTTSDDASKDRLVLTTEEYDKDGKFTTTPTDATTELVTEDDRKKEKIIFIQNRTTLTTNATIELPDLTTDYTSDLYISGKTESYSESTSNESEYTSESEEAFSTMISTTDLLEASTEAVMSTSEETTLLNDWDKATILSIIVHNETTTETATKSVISRDDPNQTVEPPTTTDNDVDRTTEAIIGTAIVRLVLPSNNSDEVYSSTEDEFSSTTTETVQNITENRALPASKVVPTKSLITFKNSEPLCRSAVCNTAASRILSLMNHSASPCEDFYEFACGGAYHVWEESAESTDADVLSTHLSDVNNSSEKYLRDFKDFYDSCVAHENSFRYTERMQTVRDLLKDVGEFREQGQTADYDITDLFTKLILRQSMPLFDIGLDVDKQSSNFILQLTLPQESTLRTGLEKWPALSLHKQQCLKEQHSKIHGRYLSLTEVYESYVDCQKNYESYLNSVEDVVRELGIFSKLNADDLRREIKDIRFCIELDILERMNALPSEDEIRLKYVNKEYDVRKVSDLQAQYPILTWKKLLTNLTGHDIQDSTIVQVYFGKYFTTVFNFLANVDRRKLNNALLAIYTNDLFMNTVISQDKSNREEFCLDLSKRLLPDVTSYLTKSLYENQMNSDRKRTIYDLFRVLVEKLRKSLSSVDWIDDDSRISIMKKLDKMNLTFFVEPDEHLLVSNYQNLNITSNYQTNLINALVHFKQSVWALEGTKITPKLIFAHFLNPSDVTPLTFQSHGLVVIPLGLMKRVINGLPGYLTMARVGLHLAREIARHFDPNGIKYAKISPQSTVVYTHLTRTMENMMDYSSPRIFGHHNISFKLNGLLSVNERIVENAAFRLISDSSTSFGSELLLPWISSTYSRDKIFFIASAQEYCKRTTLLEFMRQVFESDDLPSPLKVENIMGNSESFSEKFACPEGSGMNLNIERLQFPYLNKDQDYEETNEDLYKNK